MRHLDLFSGIGGFALAADRVWPGGVQHTFCDNDPFAQAVLRKHWPNAPIHGDIRELHPESTDLITGGFPCQPFSAAGKRRGTEDDRHLWPEMLRVIREANPRWVIGENVGGLLTWNGGMVFDEVCAGLEGEGYEVGAFVIPAAAVGAPHRRDRVWIIAHSDRSANGRDTREHESEGKRIPERHELGKSREPDSVWDASDSNAPDGLRRSGTGLSDRERMEAHKQKRERSRRESARRNKDNWREEWPTAVARLCVMDDGLSGGVVRPRGWRNAALKAAGNAIVPQVAEQIMKSIREIDISLTA